jgi:tetratricopeptide (TPR) repeat protein
MPPTTTSRRTRADLCLVACLAAILGLAVACGGAARQAPATIAAPPAVLPVQTLYEAGRYEEVVAQASATDPTALLFAAQSYVRLQRRDEASRQFARLREVGRTPAWQAVADLGLALLADDLAAIDRARAAAAAFDGDAFVQFELGTAHMRRNDFAAAARAFDRCAEISPRFAYAYYGAALAYNRLDRADLLVDRFETFLRLAGQAPERPEVESILRTARTR